MCARVLPGVRLLNVELWQTICSWCVLPAASGDNILVVLRCVWICVGVFMQSVSGARVSQTGQDMCMQVAVWHIPDFRLVEVLLFIRKYVQAT